MITKKRLGVFVFLLMIPLVFADDPYKPYLHAPTVPEAPEVKLYGAYSTNLFPGAGTYSYDIEVPPGTNGLQPSLTISYNSQTVKQRPSFLGAGWTLPQNYVMRNVNFTPSNTSDDYFVLVLNGASYDLVFDNSDGFYHTETETFARIQNLSTSTNDYNQYFLVTLKDGTKLRFGYSTTSELTSNTGKDYVLKWSLDRIEDSFNNSISYSYSEDPHVEDNGSVYLNQIVYNQDEKRKIEFDYENTNRPDRRLVFDQGNTLDETRRLSEIFVFFNDTLIRRYALGYETLASSLSSLNSIQYFGSDNSSELHSISFSYFEPTAEYQNDTNYMTSREIATNGGEDQGGRLADVNNDGYVDVLWGNAPWNEKFTQINTKNGWVNTTDFAPPEYFVSSSLLDMGMRFADVNNDGYVDLLRGNGGVNKAWLNDGESFVEDSLTWAPPTGMEFVDSASKDRGVRLIDFNGDGLVDLIKYAYVNNKGAYMNTGSGWVDVSSTWEAPRRFTGANWDDEGLRIVDLNGDGLQDFIYGQGDASHLRKAWLNDGSGWVENTDYAPPVAFITGDKKDKGIRFVDVNGDGLVDMLQDLANASTQQNGAWLNTGKGWAQDDSWKSVEAFTKSGKNVAVRLADVNGDGVSDLVVGRPSERYTLVRNTTRSYLLKNITNEFGGKTILSYATSTSFDNTGDDDKSDLGFNVWVVREVLQDNSLTGDFSVVSNTSHTYEGGLYHTNDSEFRGFSLVNETLSDGSVVSHGFHQSEALKGKEFFVETYSSSDVLFSKTENNYIVVEDIIDSGKIATVLLGSTASYQYDGASVPLVTNVSYAYDLYSNVIEKISHGFVDSLGDEKYERYEFAYNVSAWIIDKVSKYQLFDSDNLTKVREMKYYYDNSLDSVSKGTLTKTEDYLDSGTGNPVTYYTYDDFGNPYRQTDPLGRTIVFYYGTKDSTNTFPDRRVNELGHAVDYEYDVSTGNILSTAQNGITSSREYDTFGRILKEIQTFDTSENPTKSYTYDFDGSAPEVITVSQKVTVNETLDTSYYYDGFANLVQIKTPGASGNQVVKNIFYDGLFRVNEEQNPYFDTFSSSLTTPSGSEPKTSYQYDGLSRITLVTNPDSTTKTTSYNKDVIHDYDENSNFKSYYLDAYDRIKTVEEHNTDYYVGVTETYNTTYNYSAADELVKITDTKGNEFLFTYNSLGQKIKLDDPDLGIWSYGYDFAGNLISQIDNIGNEISIGYDGLNRITHKNTSSDVITFSYDEEYQGTLSSITFDNFTLSYDYDDRLRVVKETLSEGNAAVGIVNYESSSTYDSADRLLQLELPNAEDLDYYYDASGRIDEIRGFVNTTSYNAFGNPLNRTYFNEKITSFSYNSNNARLNQIQTGSDQDLSYTYDSVGNIVSIDDSVNSRNYRMSYDNLDRLTNVSINEYNWVYSFDPLGNILKIVRNHSESTFFDFASSIPHAPSTVLTVASGAAVHKQEVVTSDAKEKQVQFYLVNDKDSSVSNVNYDVTMGDGVLKTGTDFNLGLGEYALVVVNHTYASGGDYLVNVSSLTAGAISGMATLGNMFGSKADSLSFMGKDANVLVTEFVVTNSDNNASTGWNWNCDNGVSSTESFDVGVNENVWIIMEHSYSLNDNSLECMINSSDGNQSLVIPITFDNLEVIGYNSTLKGDSGITVKFQIKNSYSTLNDINWNISVDDQFASSSSPITLGQGEFTTISQDFDFSSRGVKPLTITVYSADFTDTYSENIRLYSLDLKDFINIVKNGTSRVFNFVISNTWTDLTAFWNVSDPVLSNTVNLAENETMFVIIENNYDQGEKEVVIELYNQTKREDRIVETFTIKEIDVIELETSSGDKSSISVATIANNIDKRNVSWIFDTSQSTVTSASDVELDTAESVFVIIGERYADSGVYPVNFRIDSGSHTDNESGVAIT